MPARILQAKPGRRSAQDSAAVHQVNGITSLEDSGDFVSMTVAVTTQRPASPVLILFCCTEQNIDKTRTRAGIVVPHGPRQWLDCEPSGMYEPTVLGPSSFTWTVPRPVPCKDCKYMIAELGEAPSVIWQSRLHVCPPTPLINGTGRVHIIEGQSVDRSATGLMLAGGSAFTWPYCTITVQNPDLVRTGWSISFDGTFTPSGNGQPGQVVWGIAYRGPGFQYPVPPALILSSEPVTIIEGSTAPFAVSASGVLDPATAQQSYVCTFLAINGSWGGFVGFDQTASAYQFAVT